MQILAEIHFSRLGLWERKKKHENDEVCGTWLSGGAADQSLNCNMDTKHATIA